MNKSLTEKENKILKYYSKQNKNIAIARSVNKKRTKKNMKQKEKEIEKSQEILEDNEFTIKSQNEKKEKLTKKQIVIMDD